MSPLPPFLAVEEEPLSTTQLAEFAGAVSVVAAEVHVSIPEAVEHLVTNPEFIDDESEAVQRWQISGLDTADWAMRKLAETEQKRRVVIQQAQEWRNRIDAWLTAELSPLEARAAFFEYHLERYALAQREADPKAKSLRLPSGTVRTTSKGPKVIVADEEAVIEWAKSSLGDRAASVVRTTERVMVGELKEVVRMVETEDGFYAAVSESGEVVPGVEVEPPSVSAKAVPDVG